MISRTANNRRFAATTWRNRAAIPPMPTLSSTAVSACACAADENTGLRTRRAKSRACAKQTRKGVQVGGDGIDGIRFRARARTRPLRNDPPFRRRSDFLQPRYRPQCAHFHRSNACWIEAQALGNDGDFDLSGASGSAPPSKIAGLLTRQPLRCNTALFPAFASRD